MNITYALGGGGARGIAHIGIIKALESAGIRPNSLVGCSMGAVVGAMYAQTGSAALVEKRFRYYMNSSHFKEMERKHFSRDTKGGGFWGAVAKKVDDRIKIDLSAVNKGLFPPSSFSQAIELLLDNDRIENLSIKYAAVACDLLTGKKIVLTEGDLYTAVLASGSIPGILPPVEYRNWILVDGEVSDVIPAATAKELGAEFVLAFDVSQDFTLEPPLGNALEIINRIGQIKSLDLKKIRMNSADYIITPAVGKFHWSEFSAYEDILAAGYDSGKKALDDLKKMIILNKK